MQKELIKKRFDKSLKTYEDNAVVQKQMAINLAKLIEKKIYNNILELGCGTGFLTREIVQHINYKNYYAVDIVKNCDKYIHQISDKINFICSDIEELSIDFLPDLIISNASIQWVEDLPEFVEQMMQKLDSCGSFIFTLFGQDNYKELIDIIPQKLNYYSIDSLKYIFNNYKIDYLKEDIITLNFKTPKDVLYHMKYTGVNSLSTVKWTKEDLNCFENEYLKNCGEKVTLTYNPIYIKLTKNS